MTAMTHSSQVYMVDVPKFMTQGYILSAIQKLGFRPISAVVTKDRKGGDKGVCTLQFANEGAACEVVSALNGKPLSLSSSGSACAIPFKLTQCINSNSTLHHVCVGDLAPEIDDYRLFKFFGDRFKSLCDAKVVVNAEGKSQGYGFLKFASEEDQKFCIKIMNGSLDLGKRPIKVGPVVAAPPTNNGPPLNSYAFRIMSGDPWCRYTSWNQFMEPPEYPFVAVKVKLTSSEENNGASKDNELVKYNITSNSNHLNIEALERDCHLWDALECTKWLPTMALTLPQNNTDVYSMEGSEAETPVKKEGKSQSSDSGDHVKESKLSKESSKSFKKSDISSNSSATKKSSSSSSSKSVSYRKSSPPRKSIPTKVVKKSLSKTLAKEKTVSQVKGKPVPAQRGGRIPLKRGAAAAESAKKSAARPSSASLVDTLADQITETLTQFFVEQSNKSACSLKRKDESEGYPRPAKIVKKSEFRKQPQDASESPLSGVRCYQCSGTGHMAQDCPIPPGLKLCYSCQTFGTHKAFECPKKRQKELSAGPEPSVFPSKRSAEPKIKKEQQLKPVRKRICYVCRKVTDHLAADCPEKSGRGGMGGGSRGCPASRGGGRGGRRPAGSGGSVTSTDGSRGNSPSRGSSRARASSRRSRGRRFVSRGSSIRGRSENKPFFSGEAKDSFRESGSPTRGSRRPPRGTRGRSYSTRFRR